MAENPRDWLLRVDLGASFRTFMGLWSFSSHKVHGPQVVYPSIEALCERIAKPRSTVEKHLGELARIGWFARVEHEGRPAFYLAWREPWPTEHSSGSADAHPPKLADCGQQASAKIGGWDPPKLADGIRQNWRMGSAKIGGPLKKEDLGNELSKDLGSDLDGELSTARSGTRARPRRRTMADDQEHATYALTHPTPTTPPTPGDPPDVVRQLWDEQERLRRELNPKCRGLTLTDKQRRAIAKLLAEFRRDGQDGKELCLHVLQVYAAEARGKIKAGVPIPEATRWLDGVSNWRPDNVTQRLNAEPEFEERRSEQWARRKLGTEPGKQRRGQAPDSSAYDEGFDAADLIADQERSGRRR